MIFLLESKETDPYKNMTLEYLLVKSRLLERYNSPGLLRFWVNNPCVIIGRGQDLLKEVNLDYCNQNQIKVLRRFSGGGAVFEDKGTMNLSFLFNIKALPLKPTISNLNRFFINLVLEFLPTGSSEIEIRDNTNIFVDGKKISGGASYKFQNFYLFHLTLLLDTNLTQLEQSLLVKTSNRNNRRLSRYSQTKNLKNFEYSQFKENIVNKISKLLNQSVDMLPNFLPLKDVSDSFATQLFADTVWTQTGKWRHLLELEKTMLKSVNLIIR